MSDSRHTPFEQHPDDPRVQEAERLFKKGYELQAKGKFATAAEYYKRSIELFPTAEAYTFLGWTYSFQGKLEAAIEECKRAISVDPDFGNPYNDIGAYLIELGRLDEAVPWLEQALRAKRYEPRHFPHINMARIHIMKGQYMEALAELRQALEYDPSNAGTRKELRKLLARMN